MTDTPLDPEVIRRRTVDEWIQRLKRMERSCIAELTTAEAGELARVLEGLVEGAPVVVHNRALTAEEHAKFLEEMNRAVVMVLRNEEEP